MFVCEAELRFGGEMGLRAEKLNSDSAVQRKDICRKSELSSLWEIGVPHPKPVLATGV
jgi:hypothetical protein